MEKKQYFLEKTSEGEFCYTDQDGTAWDSPKGWLWSGILGGCGCGSSEEFENLAYEVLESFTNGYQNYYEQPIKELMAHWLDSKDLLEHGSNINGSWLSPEGEKVLANIKALTTNK